MHGIDTYFNKRNILNRMKKLAVLQGGFKDADRLDPLVTLLLESLSEEIYKITGEVEKMEWRILEKITNMLVSDISLYPSPSHAVLHATPSERVTLLTKEASFFVDTSSSGKKTEISFHPVCKTRLIKGSIRHLIINGLCYSIDSDQTKTLLSRSWDNKTNDTFWIGLEVDEGIDNLKGISFYLNFSDVDQHAEYQKLFPYFNWRFESQPVNMKRGLFIQDERAANPAIELFRTFDVDHQMDQMILSHYEDNYFTIDQDLPVADRNKYTFPEELAGHYSEQFISSCTQRLVWIEVKYPVTIKEEIVSSLYVSINAFPVINKLLKHTIVSLNKANPVIAMDTKTDEHFLSIHSITDENGCNYQELPFRGENNETYKTYSLRRGGFEKYNSRDAKEYLINSYDLLEKYSLSLNADESKEDDELDEIQSHLSELMKYLKQAIARNVKDNEPKTYVQIDNPEESEILFVKYWITNTNKGNGIKTGTILTNESDHLLVPSSIVLLTGTSGGHDAPLSDERKYIYHKALEKSSLIITNEDIEDMCRNEFGAGLKSINISKGLMVDPHHTDRFLQTTHIHLKMNNKMANLLKEKDKEAFTEKLIRKSPANYNYRIVIN